MNSWRADWLTAGEAVLARLGEEREGMTRRFVVAALCSLSLAGCGTGAVYLKHPTKGDVVKCGSYFEPNPLFPGFSRCCGALKRLNDCTDEFKELGYERLSDDYDEEQKVRR